MSQAEEKCLRCGQMVMYATNEDGTFCPQCGWTREAAQSFAKHRPKEIGAHFLKSMLKAAGFLLLGVVLVWLGFDQARQTFLLGTQGREAVATVVSLDSTSSRHNTFRGRVYTYDYTIAFAGHTTKWSIHEHLDPGIQFWIVFLPKDPDMFLPGREVESAFALAKREHGITGMLLLPAFMLFAVGGFAKHIRSGIRVLSQKHAFRSELTRKADE